VRRVVISCVLAASLLGCGGTPPSSRPAESPAASPSPVAVVISTPSPATVPSPTASPSAEPTPKTVPTLTPRSAPGPDRGKWTTVKGSSLVAPDAVAVPAGDRGVLLLGSGAGPGWCEPQEGHAGGTPASFYDARTHVITRVSGDVQLRQFVVASLADGRVMIAGGYEAKDVDQSSTRRTRIWVPRTQKWTEGAPMGIARDYPYLVTLADGRVMAAGGWEDDGTYASTAELYDPVANRWTPTADVLLEMPDGGDDDQLGSLTALSGGMVLATGDQGSAALYDPVSGTWAALAWHGGWFPIALRDGTALSFGVESFGADADVSVPFAARFDPEGGTTIVSRLSPADYAATAVLGDGRVFFAGGVDGDGLVARVEVFDPDTGLLSEVASLPGVRRGSTVIALDDGSVLVVGGYDVEETQPAKEQAEPQEGPPGCVPGKYRVVRWVP
jgi:hypothetical protein